MGWTEASLIELGSLQRGRSRHRPRNDPRLFGGEMPFFQTGDVKAATLHMTSAGKCYSDLGIDQSRVWEPGVTCITIAANIAESAILGRQGCFPDSVIGFSPEQQPADAYFVKYLLDVHRERLTSAARGTTQDNLSLEKLLAHKFPMPDRTTRRQIAGVLRSVDELIENNRRRIEVMEQMARAIYREWFVHFRYPGHEDATFVDSRIGPIPDGWETKPLVAVADLTMGQSPKSEHYNSEGLGEPFHQGVKDFGPHFPTHRAFCTVDGRRAISGDILISVRAPVGRLNIAPDDLIIGRGLAAARSRTGRQALLYRCLKDLIFAEEDSMGGGTIFNAVGKRELESLDVLCASPELEDRADDLFMNNLSLVRKLTLANQRLSGMRDLLLPRLVTGRIDVSELDLAAAVGSVA